MSRDSSGKGLTLITNSFGCLNQISLPRSFTIHTLRQYKLHKQNKIKVDKSTTMYDEKKGHAIRLHTQPTL